MGAGARCGWVQRRGLSRVKIRHKEVMAGTERCQNRARVELGVGSKLRAMPGPEGGQSRVRTGQGWVTSISEISSYSSWTA